jgi:hypothetical protein
MFLNQSSVNFNYISSNRSTAVDHTPHHPKVSGLSLATTTITEKKKMSKTFYQIDCFCPK